MLSAPYSLHTDYGEDTPVSSLDLDRRAKILGAQLPGALRAAGLVAGVMPLWKPAPELPFDQYGAALASAAQGALLVTKSGGVWQAGAGAALIELGDESGSGLLVYTQTDGLTEAVQTPVVSQTLYIHLSLQVPDDVTAPGALDSLVGDAPLLSVSDVENEPHSLLLASVNDTGVLTDRRAFSLSVLLAQEMARLRARLDALDTPAAPGAVGVTPAQFGALQKRVSDLEGALDIYRQNAGNDAVVGTQETSSSLIVNMGKLIGNIVNLDPTSARQFLAGIDIPDATGDSQNLNGTAQGQARIGGNAFYDEESGSVHG